MNKLVIFKLINRLKTTRMSPDSLLIRKIVKLDSLSVNHFFP
jgi:hypothetical protein